MHQLYTCELFIVNNKDSQAIASITLCDHHQSQSGLEIQSHMAMSAWVHSGLASN